MDFRSGGIKVNLCPTSIHQLTKFPNLHPAITKPIIIRHPEKNSLISAWDLSGR